jgi:cyclopropane-fatty-acyl-phospholipid synthase
MNVRTAAANSTLAERTLELVFSRLRAGQLDVVWRDGCVRRFTAPHPGPFARIELRDPNAAVRLLQNQAIGMAEGYMAGEWDTPDLDAVLDLGLANLIEKPVGFPQLLNPLVRTWHALRGNSVAGSRRNIAHHYDLGNEFYELWLDESMAYSSALFERPDEDLTPAQIKKWDRLLELLQPGRKDHILEIGCGWGGFAIYAAQQSGCRVTGITLSEEQLAFATDAACGVGLEDRIEFLLEDYRQTSGSFSGVASIEMFEAVGCRWWPVFFERIRDLVVDGGAIALQTITIADARFEEYRRRPDFIQRYIFPGGMLPSPRRFRESAESKGLNVGDEHFFGDSYSRTLAAWRERFEAAVPQVLALGFDERFVRMWRYYLAYCRAGFDAKTIDVMQVRLDV